MVTFPGPGLFPRRIAGHHGDRDRAPPGAAADPTSASTGGHPVIRGPHRGGNEPTTSPGGDMTSLGYRRPLSRRQRVWALVPALLLLLLALAIVSGQDGGDRFVGAIIPSALALIPLGFAFRGHAFAQIDGDTVTVGFRPFWRTQFPVSALTAVDIVPIDAWEGHRGWGPKRGTPLPPRAALLRRRHRRAAVHPRRRTALPRRMRSGHARGGTDPRHAGRAAGDEAGRLIRSPLGAPPWISCRAPHCRSRALHAQSAATPR